MGLDWANYVQPDLRYSRPSEVDLLIGDAGKARRQLGWEPKTKFKERVKLMVAAAVDLLKAHRAGKIKATH